MRYSRKLAALGRVSAGIAHEVKNPLNAMAIHLELVRLQVQERMSTGRDETLAHLEVIGAEVRRLDDVLSRRSRCLLLDARATLAVAPAVADLMATELGWDAARREREVVGFLTLARSYLPPGSQ